MNECLLIIIIAKLKSQQYKTLLKLHNNIMTSYIPLFQNHSFQQIKEKQPRLGLPFLFETTKCMVVKPVFT
jgi:hypothetical protein